MRIVLLIIISSFLCVPVSLCATDLTFSQISSHNGLSQNTVRAIEVDHNGFVWAGTLDGLNRYDGYNNRSYQPQLGNPNVLDDHRIKELHVDKEGYLWVKTYRNEFSCYDPVSDLFVPLKHSLEKHLTYTSYYESTRGEVWLWGKYDGIARIQKEKMPTLQVDKFLPRSLRGEACHFLYEDADSTIWFGGEIGLYRIVDNEVVAVEYPGKESFVFTQAVELQDKIYFSTQESVLVIYDKNSGTIDYLRYEGQDPFVNMVRLSEKELLIVMQSLDLLIYNVETARLYASPLNRHPSFANELRTDVRIHIDRYKRVWLYNRSGIVWYYDQEQKRFEHIHLIPRHVAAMIDLGQIFVDSTGLVWFITYGYGVFCYDMDNRELANYRYESAPNSLPSNYLLDIAEDRFGTIWLGSEYAGIIRVVKTPEYIRFVRPEPHTIIGQTNNVRTMLEDSQKNIWIGTKNGGLYIYDSGLTHGRCLAEQINPYSLIEDDHGRIWVGTKGNGIYLYDMKTHRVVDHLRSQPDNPASLSSDILFHLMKDNKGRIWAGSFEGGVTLIEEEKGAFRFKRFMQDVDEKSFVRYLFQDSQGRIWVGSNGGLMRFFPERLIKDPLAYAFYEKDSNMKHSISSNDIKVIYEDSDHTIWIGTAGGGLNQFVESTEEQPEHFIAYSAAHGMADNFVLGILEHGNDLWISSESGLSRFTKERESFVTYQFAQRSFGNIFNEGAFCQTQEGDMLWGTLDGLLVFKPDRFDPDVRMPAVLLTRLTVDREDWNDIRRAPFDKSITYSDKIKLTYKQNTFSLDFAAMNLRNPAENRYSYILENYDKQWSLPTDANTATYKNLPHGKYTFKVKGINPGGSEDDQVTSLQIVITPPFWLSLPAYIFYFLLVCLLFYIAFRVIVKFNRLNTAVEVEKQLTNHKLRFFTNISHEFRTPLTLIQGAVENLNEETGLPASATKQIHILDRHATNLRRLIDQLLEFRKIQNDVLRLDLEEVDMIAFAREIYSGFQELAERKNIDYRFSSSSESLSMFIDRKKVDKILYNLLSNAFKFTPNKGLIELLIGYDASGESCTISVKDSGIGIPKEKQHLLFSRFTQINFSTSGTGVGLSLVKEFIDVHKGKISYESNPGGGSIFKVELSTDRETYKGENFIASSISDIQKEESSPAYIPAEESGVDSQTLAAYQLLIIDDNDDIRSFLTEEFSKYMKVETAADGKEGLQKAIELNPDLIICDVMMPEMDGFEVTRQLKSEFQTCHIPIILLTAHSSIEHQLEGIESGADAYITKPFSLKYIVKRVMKLIEQRELLKKRFSKEFVIDGNLVKTTDKDSLFLERIEKILADNYHNSQFTLDQFVELSGMKRTIFFKKVKGITGFSPNELLKMKRLNQSALLLKQETLTVSEISYKVGFDDPYYFSKCFKIHFDCTPTQYRNAPE
ncbi:signal transduction histidine kinase/ligand-binding sensor domain-containing protein/DNA-binding NarL/FixJ family response regulator [Parabacteroides sp. PFB2-12]|uniref:hybrid sensor histidine kinase/response regulator transcription factor n=1 Tax=unclassified Parabacteroides TaxID=2649774 RepID=UPI0024747B03|nr:MULTISPECIES: two-component regulator propeller domain-containing protein [unclassified Parabacteroides]MDH6342368.1 signal transduction histidine kinase/ligand-binding sensor domain-containing protein/DNA-binding NarL/FixJ family response regulator [Parabacteroides sp. PM6-13]MDH6390711.1 signal transduction histidine kinase/ligand-binding sensor domain-containing protein/DNA-binding NarL/FixJ family response regulator [Parabacteroides sp. PFB2-12]